MRDAGLEQCSELAADAVLAHRSNVAAAPSSKFNLAFCKMRRILGLGIIYSVAPCRLETPRITRQPQGAELEEGRPFTLSVGAEGSQPLSYQWEYGGRRLHGETSPELHVQVW